MKKTKVYTLKEMNTPLYTRNDMISFAMNVKQQRRALEHFAIRNLRGNENQTADLKEWERKQKRIKKITK